MVSAAGVTRSDTPLLTIENTATFGNSEQRRLVIVGGLNGDERGGRAILGAIAWFKTRRAPSRSAGPGPSARCPSADPHQHARARPYDFPPLSGFFDDADQPESRYAWRWASFQAPDLVLEVWGGDSMSWHASDVPALKAAGLPRGSLAAAMAQAERARTAAVRRQSLSRLAQPMGLSCWSASEGGCRVAPIGFALRHHRSHGPKSPRNRRRAGASVSRNAVVNYIPSVAWTNTLRLAAILVTPRCSSEFASRLCRGCQEHALSLRSRSRSGRLPGQWCMRSWRQQVMNRRVPWRSKVPKLLLRRGQTASPNTARAGPRTCS